MSRFRGAVVAVLLAAGVALVGAPSASAGDHQDSVACREATAVLTKAVALTVLFNPNVYPNNVVPKVGDINPALLTKILADPDLGAGARATVQAALKAFQVRYLACHHKKPRPTTTTVTTVTSGVTSTVIVAVPQVTVVPSGAPETGAK